MITNLSARLPHIVIALDGEVHIISIVQLRALAGGAAFEGDADKLISVLAKYIVDSLE